MNVYIYMHIHTYVWGGGLFLSHSVSSKVIFYFPIPNPSFSPSPSFPPRPPFNTTRLIEQSIFTFGFGFAYCNYLYFTDVQRETNKQAGFSIGMLETLPSVDKICLCFCPFLLLPLSIYFFFLRIFTLPNSCFFFHH